MKKVVLFFLLIVSLSGCWDQRIFERTGFILQVGIESAGKGELILTKTSPVVGVEAKGQVELITTKSDNIREARENWKKTTPRILEGGKIQQILFSDEVAQKGIDELLEIFERDPANPALAYVVVVDGSPKELIEKTMKLQDKPRTAFYINQLLEGNVQFAYVPETRVYNFDIAYFAPGLDPVTPLIKFGKEEIVVAGSALFSGDRLVGKITTQETSLLLALMNKFDKTQYIFKSSPLVRMQNTQTKSGVAILLFDAKRKISITFKDEKPVVKISLSFSGNIDEYKWDNLADAKEQEKITQLITDELKQDLKELIQYLQEVGSDPIGIGDLMRARHNAYWQQVKWSDAYRDAEIIIEPKIVIKQFGTIQ